MRAVVAVDGTKSRRPCLSACARRSPRSAAPTVVCPAAFHGPLTSACAAFPTVLLDRLHAHALLAAPGRVLSMYQRNEKGSACATHPHPRRSNSSLLLEVGVGARCGRAPESRPGRASVRRLASGEREAAAMHAERMMSVMGSPCAGRATDVSAHALFDRKERRRRSRRAQPREVRLRVALVLAHELRGKASNRSRRLPELGTRRPSRRASRARVHRGAATS